MNNLDPQPLRDIRVLELASVLAGPSVGMFLAELGAEVIKVENASGGGDVTRSWKLAGEPLSDDRPAYFSSVNRGKKSIALDLSESKDRQRLDALLGISDILIVSFKPGDAEKFSLDAESVMKRFPHVIHASVTGYGEEDPRTAFDAILQAETGFMYMNGTPESGPVKMPVALIDVLAGHQLKEAILLALMARMKDGKGRKVAVSLFDSAIASLVNQGANWLVAGTLPRRMGSGHPNIVPYGNTFRTADDKDLLLAVGNDRQFRLLCEILQLAELADVPEYATNPQRVKNRDSLLARLAAAIRKRESGELLKRLQEARVPAACVLDMQEVFRQPAARRNLTGPEKTGIRSAVFLPPAELCDPPRLDADRQEILKRIGEG